MIHIINNGLRACLFACLCICASACYETDDYYNKDKNPEESAAKKFDFSTTQKIDLVVDYSEYELHGSVLFSVYNENPIVNEGTYYEYVDETIEPVFEAYTDANGFFDESVVLPAYSKVLHIVTGNFMIGLRRDMVEVDHGLARMKATRSMSAAPTTRAPMPEGATAQYTTSTDNLWLSYTYKSEGKTYIKNKRLFKDWNTPLGSWNEYTGRPTYVNPTDLPAELQFPEDLRNGLYETVCNAVQSGKTCKLEYEGSRDLTLVMSSEVSICALGSMTCWNSSFGYYYYPSGNPPRSRDELNIIMLFPNTQDGKRYSGGKTDYHNNVGMERGDVIQLMYYPNIGSEDESVRFSGATTIFPQGTSIGFILKPGGWGSQGDAYCTTGNNGSLYNAKMNIWSASTPGISYSDNAFKSYNYPNTTAEVRMAKFAYSYNNKQYAVVSVEDACDDKDFDDLVFALNPGSAFTQLEEVGQSTTRNRGVFAFEDRWPSEADYDMNDLLVECTDERSFSGSKVSKQKFTFITGQNFAADHNSLALRLTTPVSPSKITMTKNGQSVTFPKNSNGEVYIMSSDYIAEMGSTYVVELTYGSAIDLSKVAEAEPFLYRVEGDKTWEVHIPDKAPTALMDMDYFHTGDDISEPQHGKYYRRRGDYPFSFYLHNATLDYFRNNILLRTNESVPIDKFFPLFLDWSISEGKVNADWYLHPSH